MKKLLLCLCLLLLPALSFAWQGEVVSVTDGDTVVVLRKDTGQKVKVRLYGIDAPEGKGKRWKPQPYSRQATDKLKSLLPSGSTAVIMDMGYDRYTRTVGGIVSLPGGEVAYYSPLLPRELSTASAVHFFHFLVALTAISVLVKSAKLPSPPAE